MNDMGFQNPPQVPVVKLPNERARAVVRELAEGVKNYADATKLSDGVRDEVALAEFRGAFRALKAGDSDASIRQFAAEALQAVHARGYAAVAELLGTA